MFDFIQGFGKSTDEKRMEALNAYLDDALSPRERQQLETDLQDDAALRAELEQMRIVKQALLAMPRRRVPRSFSLDPALYGVPKARPAQQLYPLLRGATVLTALLFILVLGLGALDLNLGGASGAQVEAVTIAEPAAESAQFIATVPAAELELQPAPQAAEAGITIEEPVAENGAEPGMAEATTVEEPAFESAGASDAAADERPAADITSRKEFSGTVEALATANAAGPEPYAIAGATADAEAATTDDFGLPAAGSMEAVGIPISTAAVWLGLATLILLGLTLLARSRSRL